MQEDITIGEMPVYLSYPDDGKTHPGLIVIHEIWGLVEHIKHVADRFAAQGYCVLAPNLFYDQPFVGKIDQSLLAEMQNPATRDEAQKKMRAATAPVRSPEFATKALGMLSECIDYLASDGSVNGCLGVLGFCFGGTYSFHLAAHDSRIQAAVPFYGQPPTPEEITTIDCPILAFYGDQDANLMQSLPHLREDMKKSGKKFETVVYQNAGHAFFNDTNPRTYNPRAAKDAWDKTIAFLKKNLA